MNFRGRGTERLVSNAAVHSGAFSILKAPLNTAILPGMERKNRGSTIRCKTFRQNAKKIFKHAEFVVHRDAKRLERAANRRVAFPFANGPRQRCERVPDDLCELAGSLYVLSARMECFCDKPGVRFVRIFAEDFR